jgi:hypothetical protein
MQYLNRVVPYTVPFASLCTFWLCQDNYQFPRPGICDAENTRVCIVLTCIVWRPTSVAALEGVGHLELALLGLRVQNPPVVWICVLCKCLCCQIEVSAMGGSLVQKSPAECGVSGCDCAASIMRRPWPSKGLLHHDGGGGDYEVNDRYCDKCLLNYFNLSAAFFCEILKFLYSVQFTNFGNTCLQAASFFF